MAEPGVPHKGRKPNIIFILTDDLGYTDLGCYGGTRCRTPNLDRLAAEGTRFTQVYAGSPVCAPSRCALMNGLHTGHARIRGNFILLRGRHERLSLRADPEDLTVAALLKAAGYATGIVGKWGLAEPGTGGVPTRKGFDYWFGYLNQRHAHSYYPDYLWRNEEQVPIPGNAGGAKVVYSHDLVTREMLEFVRRNAARPFFLYVATTIPHGRLEPPDDQPFSDMPWTQEAKNYAAMVWRLDRDMGRLMGLLEELGLDRDTIVFFTSDNGRAEEGTNEPFRGMKRDLYEGGIRVPMVVRWPGGVPAAAVSGAVWTFWDFLPMACDLAGAPIPGGLDGLPMTPALFGQAPPEHEHLYWEFYENGFEQAIRAGRWKGVRHAAPGPIELYDLQADVSETTDLASRHADVVRRLDRLMAEAHRPPEFSPHSPREASWGGDMPAGLRPAN